MSNEQKLLPCPFCGCKAKTEISVDGWKSIKCVGCRAKTSRFSTIEVVIKSWNQRTRTDTSQQQVEKPLPFCNECEEKDCQVSMDGYCNFIRRYKKSFEIERANKDLSQVNTRNSLLVAENMEQAERIQELEQQNQFLTNAKDEMVQRACADYELAIAELKQQTSDLIIKLDNANLSLIETQQQLANAKADGIDFIVDHYRSAIHEDNVKVHELLDSMKRSAQKLRNNSGDVGSKDKSGDV